MSDEFYKDKYFEIIQNDLTEIKTEVKKLQAQVTWIYATSATISAIVGLAISLYTK